MNHGRTRYRFQKISFLLDLWCLISTGLRPPRHRALTAISILDMAFAVEPVVWATSQNLNDHAWCNVHASPLDQAGVGPRTASVYIYDGVKKSENGGTIFVAKSLVLKKILIENN